MPDLKVIVLAAGKGTRMGSEAANLPKVMRIACGKPMLSYVLAALDFVPKEDTILVTGFLAQTVTDAFPDYPAVLQQPQLGTGHAVQCARSHLEGFEGTVLICCGDMPLVRKETFQGLLAAHRSSGAQCTLLSGTSDVPLAFGRVMQDEQGNFLEIVEDRDCTPEQKLVPDLNAGIYCFENSWLLDALDGLRNENAQNEYYLTDVPALIQAAGGTVRVHREEMNEQMIGVNTPEQLELVERYLSGGGH